MPLVQVSIFNTTHIEIALFYMNIVLFIGLIFRFFWILGLQRSRAEQALLKPVLFRHIRPCF